MGQVVRPVSRAVRSLAVLGLVAALVAGCASGGTASNAAPTTSPSIAAIPTSPPPSATATPAVTASAAPAPSGPAAFQLTVTGDKNVTGTWGTSFGVDCNNPTFDGPDILFFAQSPDTKAVVLITLNEGAIDVSERAGAGATYTSREFSGTGVTAFDAGRGATFDSDLTIVPTPDAKPGTLGTITHVSGTTDCGGQTPGSSTVVASGASPEGAVNGPFSAFRVTCVSSAQFGKSVSVSAVIDAATPPVYMIFNMPANNKGTIFMISKPSTQHTYLMDEKKGAYTISDTGAHVDADFVEVIAAGAAGPAHTIHLAGDVVCGTTVKS